MAVGARSVSASIGCAALRSLMKKALEKAGMQENPDNYRRNSCLPAFLRISIRQVFSTDRQSISTKTIAARGKPTECISGCDLGQCASDGLVEILGTASFCGAQARLDFAPHLFDRVEVWRLGRQKEYLGARSGDELERGFALVGEQGCP
jgi:hypothetical protein